MSRTGVSPAEIQKHLKDMDYPARKQDLVNHAKSRGADQDILSILEQLQDQQFNNAADVSKAIGQVQ